MVLRIDRTESEPQSREPFDPGLIQLSAEFRGLFGARFRILWPTQSNGQPRLHAQCVSVLPREIARFRAGDGTASMEHGVFKAPGVQQGRSEEHTSELQSQSN